MPRWKIQPNLAKIIWSTVMGFCALVALSFIWQVFAAFFFLLPLVMTHMQHENGARYVVPWAFGQLGIIIGVALLAKRLAHGSRRVFWIMLVIGLAAFSAWVTWYRDDYARYLQ